MTSYSRPNKEALTRAIDIFREQMRPFLTRCLSRLHAESMSEAITRMLDDQQAREFERNLKRVGDVESAIDVSIFPRLVSYYWKDVFSTEFDGDKTTIERNLKGIRKARNLTSHPPFGRDLDGVKTREHLRQIAAVLRCSGAKEGTKAVEVILTELELADCTLEDRAQRDESHQSLPDEDKNRVNWLTGAAIGVTALVAIAGTVIAFIELDSTDPDE